MGDARLFKSHGTIDIKTLTGLTNRRRRGQTSSISCRMAPSFTSGRRGPNVSHFLRDLNTIASDKALDEAEFTFEDDLAMFTNTQFFDYDSGQNTDYQAHPIKSELDTTPSSAVSTTDELQTPAALNEMAGLDFMSGKFMLHISHSHILMLDSHSWRRIGSPS